MPFKPGQSGNKKGRPKGSLNKNTPQQVLVKALSNGADLKDLKRLALELIDPDNGKVKLTESQVVQVLKLLVETEVKLTELYLKYDPTKEDEKEIEAEKVEDIPAFSLKAIE